jgi:hypothetical protein
MSTYNDRGVARRAAITQDDVRTVFGQVIGPVALTVGGAALGALRCHRLGALHQRLRVHVRAMTFRPTLAPAAS